MIESSPILLILDKFKNLFTEEQHNKALQHSNTAELCNALQALYNDEKIIRLPKHIFSMFVDVILEEQHETRVLVAILSLSAFPSLLKSLESTQNHLKIIAAWERKDSLFCAIALVVTSLGNELAAKYIHDILTDISQLTSDSDNVKNSSTNSPTVAGNLNRFRRQLAIIAVSDNGYLTNALSMHYQCSIISYGNQIILLYCNS